MSPRRGPGRLVRVGALGLAALALAVGAHVAGGGGVPGAVALALGVVVCGLLALAATARRLGRVSIGAVLLLTQAALHTLFSLVPAPGGPAPAGPVHLHHVAPVAAGAHGAHEAGAAMLVAHLLATVATAAVLAHGEAWLWGLWRFVVRAVPGLGRVALGRVEVARPVTFAEPRALPGLLRSGAIGVRGPPAVSF